MHDNMNISPALGRSGLGSDGSDGDIDREVRYTDHEYEDDTSDGEDDQINTRVPFLPGSGTGLIIHQPKCMLSS